VQNQGNDYLIDRAYQRKTSFTGIDHIHIQDQAVTESMGDISDHGFENLAISDRMIMVTRRRILQAAKDLDEKGELPPGSTTPDAYGRQRGGYFTAPNSRPWPEVYHHQLASVGNQGTTEAAE
jgi:hypothetical protein